MMVDRDKAARELIAFYHEVGVDTAIGEDPIDRLAEDRAPALEGPITARNRRAVSPSGDRTTNSSRKERA